MAEIVKDFTNDNSGFEQVLFQRGRKIIDGEMNEVGRLIRVSQKRQNLFPSSDQGEEAGEYGFPFVQGLEIVPNGASTTEIIVQPIAGRRALIAYRGYVFELTAPITLTGVSSGLGSVSVQQVYVTFTESEISAAADPSILVSQLGETARRIKADVQISLSAANVDEAGAASTASEPWEGGTKACVIAEIRKESGAATALTGAELQYKYIRTLDMEAFNQNVVISSMPVAGGETGYFQFTTPNLLITNIRVTVPMSDQQPTGFGSGYIQSETVPLPAFGDCVVLEVPIDLTADATDFTYTQTPTAKQGKISVINQTDLILNHAFTENARRLIILAYRGYSLGAGTEEIILCDGSSISFIAPLAGLPRGGRHYVGNHRFDRDMPYHSISEFSSPTDTSDETPYMATLVRPQADSYKLLFQARQRSPANEAKTRLYHYEAVATTPQTPGNGASPISGQVGSGLAYTYNASWDASAKEWVPDVGTEFAHIWKLNAVPVAGTNESTHILGGMIASPVPASWTDADWGSNATSGVGGMDIGLSEGYLIGTNEVTSYLDNFSYMKLSTTFDPIAPTPPATNNRLYALNMVKAHAAVISGGAGAGTLGTGGYGITTVANQTPPPATGRGLDVTLANPFVSTAAYQVIATVGETQAPYIVSVENITTTVFRIWLRDFSGVLQDISGLPATRINVIVMGFGL